MRPFGPYAQAWGTPNQMSGLELGQAFIRGCPRVKVLPRRWRPLADLRGPLGLLVVLAALPDRQRRGQ